MLFFEILSLLQLMIIIVIKLFFIAIFSIISTSFPPIYSPNLTLLLSNINIYQSFYLFYQKLKYILKFPNIWFYSQINLAVIPNF